MNKQGENGIEWRTVVGYEGLYQVSSDGQVRSLPRRTTRGKVLTPQLNNSGYLRVSVTNRSSQYLYVHHLVAEAFIGQRPTGVDVNHINGIKTDNRAENREYVTHSQNMEHAIGIGLQKNFGETHYNARLTLDQVKDILQAHFLCGLSAEEMASTLDVSVQTVKDVLNKRTWRRANE